MIHFDGPYVNGFFVPQAKDEKDALKQLKESLVQKKKRSIKDRERDSMSDELSFRRVRSALRSLKKPWRYTKKSIERGRKESVVRVMKWNKPLLTGYWLTDIETGGHLCNIQ